VQKARIAIVGGGLSGLYAAFLLEQKGITDYVLLEGRDALGGRIASVSGSGHPVPLTANAGNGVDRFDLGPAWFWPDYQHQLDRLVQELGLQRFAQSETGHMKVERSPNEPPIRTRGYMSSPTSMRLVGGMGALIDALRCRLDGIRIITGQRVWRLRDMNTCIELDSENAGGTVTTWKVGHVLLAMPPRLIEDSIEFLPALPQALARQWRTTATWMASHAKYIAIYETPFWREQGLSGEARSMRGPLGEIHDASMHGGSAALSGFFGVSARERQSVPEDELRSHCRAQLARLFGPQAAKPRADVFKDWSLDSYTATAADLDGVLHHAEAPDAGAASGPWSGRLTGIASEWSPQFPGYIAGAIEAASLGVQALPVFGVQTEGTSAIPAPWAK